MTEERLIPMSRIRGKHASLDTVQQSKEYGNRRAFDVWKISRIRSAGNCKKCPLKKRRFQRALCVC